MRKKWILGVLGLLGVALVAALLLGGSKSSALPPVTVPENALAGDLTTLEACEFTPPGTKETYDAECGTLTVPENWQDPNSRLIALPVVRILATGPEPAEPVFWLEGGPGSTNLSWAPPKWLLEKHDVVEVGYRGADGSVVLQCPNVMEAIKGYRGHDSLGEEARAGLASAAKQCAADFEAEGVDLAGYRVSAVLRDMEVVRSALGYEKINLYGVSYGTRVGQLYAYMYPDSLHRVVLVSLNTPGRFVWDRDEFDDMLLHISDLCAQDPTCSNRTDNVAQTMYDVNRNMPDRWLFLPIDSGMVRIGTHQMFFHVSTMPLILDAYIAAGQGDPSGLAMLTLMGRLMPFPSILGDQFNKGGTLDLEHYQGNESVNLGASIMGAPMAELLWSMASSWPIELEDKRLRQLRESDVEMLLVNGSVDFSTPPHALDEVKPYYSNAQVVLLSEFGHVADVEGLQPEAFERLVTSYYDTGVADDSLFEYEPLSFTPRWSAVKLAKVLVGATIVIPPLLVGAVVLVGWRIRRRQAAA
jgi:pimeloyl-ACP methyl ester carboxylesterase